MAPGRSPYRRSTWPRRSRAARRLGLSANGALERRPGVPVAPFEKSGYASAEVEGGIIQIDGQYFPKCIRRAARVANVERCKSRRFEQGGLRVPLCDGWRHDCKPGRGG